MDTWNPALGQELLLKPEPSNYKDKHAVAVLKDDVIVGYVPYNLAPRLSQFLKREVNKAFAEVMEQGWSQDSEKGEVHLTKFSYIRVKLLQKHSFMNQQLRYTISTNTVTINYKNEKYE